jgi:hypothetical protein
MKTAVVGQAQIHSLKSDAFLIITEMLINMYLYI